MIGRNISFIIGQHHHELDLAVAYHHNRDGVVFEDATLHESMKREVMALLFEKTVLAESIAARAEVDLNLRGGLALTDAGPIVYLLWWMPPVDSAGVPFAAYEQLLNPMHEGTRNTLRELARVKYLHVALIGSGPRILALHEFLNEFGFDDIHASAQAAFETWAAAYDFGAAYASYERMFTVDGLLKGLYPERTRAVGPVLTPD